METLACTNDCPIVDIAAYLDGELTSHREMELETHFASCRTCLDELNDQKLFLRSLESSLREEGEIELPADFAKTVVVRAESSVTGLRRGREQFNAIFICTGLFLFVLFALGSDGSGSVRSFTNYLEQLAAVSGFFGHLFYTFFLGALIVVRTLASQVHIGSAAAGLVALGAIAFLLMASRRLRLRRA